MPVVADDPYAAVERELFRAVNKYRVSKGKRAQTWSDDVAAVARGHSWAMATGDVSFGHAGFKQRMGKIGEKHPFTGGAENVSKHWGRDASELRGFAMKRWIDSSPHRKNLESGHDLTGIGVARAKDGTFFVTQIFVTTR